MRTDHAKSRWSAPRLLGLAAALVGTLLLVLIAYSGSAGAVGPTDLSLTKSDSPDPVTAGNNLTYTIQVKNNGPDDASAVSVSDNLPSQVDYKSSSTTAGTCTPTGNTVNCVLGAVTNGTTVTVTIVVKTKKAGTISNTATLTSVDDNTPANNADTEATTVVKAAKGKKKGKASCASPTIKGTTGPDVINGTAGGDVIATYGGNDQVFAGGGKDLVCSGAGVDLVLGGTGGDTLIGGGGADRLKGNGGSDLLKGKNGRDRLRGQSGNDVLNGGKKRDSCKGGAGRDTLIRCP